MVRLLHYGKEKDNVPSDLVCYPLPMSRNLQTLAQYYKQELLQKRWQLPVQMEKQPPKIWTASVLAQNIVPIK